MNINNMKTLQQHIEEKLVINKNSGRTDYFVYKINERKPIQIFDCSWPQFNEYKDKVYINGEHVELDKYGYTCKEYNKGEYEIKIKDIDNITNCFSMFWGCDDLISVPLFDTSKVKNMHQMFYQCHNITYVPLFDTRKVEYMVQMFCECKKLNKQTKQKWSKFYDFKKQNKI